MSTSMIALKTVYPGQPGTKKLQKQYGDRLVCVRYCDDAVQKERIKTVEVIVARDPWVSDPRRIPPNSCAWEKELGLHVKAARGGLESKEGRVGIGL